MWTGSHCAGAAADSRWTTPAVCLAALRLSRHASPAPRPARPRFLFPQSLMTQALPRVFPGYFRLHYCRAKYVLTPGIVLQVRGTGLGGTE